MTTSSSLTDAGYIVRRTDEWRAILEDQVTTAMPGANTAAGTVFGQLVGLLSGILAERDEQNLAVYSAQSINAAEGTSLTNIALSMGRQRLVGETDSQLRYRLLSVGLSNATPNNANSNMSAAIQAISGVEYVSINEDVSAGGYEVVVIGGDDAAIAEAIYSYHSAGSNMIGSTVMVVEDILCNDVRFTRPVAVPVCLNIVIDPIPNAGDCDVNATGQFNTAVYEWLSTGNSGAVTPIGLSLELEQLYSPLQSVGIVKIVSAEYSTNNGTTFQPLPLQLSDAQYATFDVSCISVTFSP